MNDSQAARIKAMFDTREPAPLGPEPREGRRSIDELRRGVEATADKNADSDAILSLLLLWHDHLDESHTISQNIHTPDGSFIHGIMHRREPDFGNARYWFNRVGNHPAFPEIARRALALDATAGGRKLLESFCKNGQWNPYTFIEACERARRAPGPDEELLRRVQQVEFSVLLDRLISDS
jgi:hypothetical protein